MSTREWQLECARLQENVQVAEQRCRSVSTFCEGLDAWEEWHTARRCLWRFLQTKIDGKQVELSRPAVTSC
jgi:hypothetical protein